MAEVQLQFAGHNEEVDAEPWRDFLAWLLAEPGPSGGLSGAPVVRTSGTGVEVVALAVTIGSALEARELADSLVMWLKRRNGDVTVKLTVPGKTAELRRETEVAELDRFLLPLITAPPDAVGEMGLDTRAVKTPRVGKPGGMADFRRITFEAGADGSYRKIDRTETDGLGDGPDLGHEEIDASTMPITIYLSNEDIHQQVEAAIEAVLAVAGLQIESRGNPIAGSWFRRMRAAAKSSDAFPGSS